MPLNEEVKNGLNVFKNALVTLKSQTSNKMPTSIFEFQDNKITAKLRQANNNSAVELMRKLELEQNRKATDEEKLILSRYTGKGGNLEVEGVKGSQYEYYTPLPLANAMWDLIKDLGFDGGAVLDPCAGTGIFSVGRPANTIMQSVELDHISGSINAMVNDQDNHNVIVSPFEAVASRTEDNTYDAVITNVPFGSKMARGNNARLDIYADDDLDTYFVKRSIDKLKHGKLGVFLASTKLMSGSASRKFRQQIALKAELIGAYRLPNKVFHPTGADVVTDIIVFRKHSQDMTEKLDNLYQNGQLNILTESRVLDPDIIDGKYFKTEGIKNILGQSIQVPDWRNKQREIEAVVSDDSLANILKMIRRFPATRIDYDMLELTDNLSVASLQDGDIRVMNGTTFEYHHGQFIPIKSESGFEYAENFETALMAFHSSMTIEQFREYVSYSASSQVKAPAWINKLIDVMQGNDRDAYAYWLTQFAVFEALQSDISSNYSERYTALTSAMKAIAKTFASNKYKSKALRSMLNYNAKAFDGSDLSAYWYGSSIEAEISLDVKSAYENAVYMGRADNFMVSIDEIRTVDPDFNPYENDEYAINADGTKVSLNRDYYTGNYGALLERLQSEIDATDNIELREKLIRQRNKASEYINNINVNNLNLSLRATNIDIAIKSEFLSLFGGDDVFVNSDNRVEVQTKVEKFEDVLRWVKDGSHTKEVRIYFLNRLLDSVNNNSRLTLRLNKDVSRTNHDLVMTKFIEYVKELDATFLSYLQSNEAFMAELDIKINDPYNKTMVTELDDSPIKINGFNPKFESFKAMQTYQNAEIRRLSRRFEGIVGFDVGLGKTLTALATARNLHNIGVKKRTVFVVPSHTISKWYRDTKMCLDDHSDVLVIGSKENSLESINSAQYATDLNLLIQSKQWRMVLMTSDAFTMIPLRESSIEKYYSKKLSGFDLTKDKDKQAYNAFLSSKVDQLQSSKGRLPYFEDLGIDSIVFDEAQMFKNGDASEGTGNFQTIRGLSLLTEGQLSLRATSAKIKSSFVRNQSALGDGVVLLSATPITNSPSEILTMLSLAVGDRKAMDILGGASIDSVDDFLSTFANTESIEGVDITGAMRSDETFTGFKNVELLKNALHTVANIQTARENELQIPDEEPVRTNVDLSPSDRGVLADLKRAYAIAKASTKDGTFQGDADDLNFLEDMSKRLGEPPELIAHPFNLISKMQDLILMGQESVLERGFYIKYIAPEDETLAQRIVDLFNAKPTKFLTKRNYPLVEQDDLKIKKRAQNFGDSDEYEVTVRAFLDEDNTQLCLTANDLKAIASLFELAEKNNLRLKPKLSAKMQALIDNVKQELTTPLHNGHSKQIIFCDALAMHHTIKQALIEYCGIESSRIAILNASIKPDGSSGKVGTDDVQDIQDGFASDKYTIVIANKKADTGIDLQRGTQAIHHLTTGWTPDSLQQRNGRGIRQGNQQRKVRVYMYNANGSFDEYKLHIISGKSSWINSLMDKNAVTAGVLKISGEISDDELDLMIQADSQDAMNRLLIEREERAKADQLKRATAKTEMLISIAHRSAVNADLSLDKSTEELITSDYKKYVTLMKLQAKTAKKEKLIQIQSQKEAIIRAYDAYIPNNTTANWDAGLSRYAEPRAIAPNYVSSMRSLPFGDDFNSNKLIEIIFAEDKGGIRTIADNKYQSIQRMAEATKAQVLNDVDSPFSQEDREMLINKSAYIDSATKALVRHGDIFKAISNDEKVIYGIKSVQNLRFDRHYSVEGSSIYSAKIESINVNERVHAIDAFVQFEYEAMKRNEVFKYEDLSASSLKSIAKFSSILPEVQQGVERLLSQVQESWINESKRYRHNTVRLKETRNYYWAENQYRALYNANPELVSAINKPFEGIVTSTEKDGLIHYLNIPNNQLHLVDITYPRALGDFYDDLLDIAEAYKIKLNYVGVEQGILNDFYQRFGRDIRESMRIYNVNSVQTPYSFNTVLNDQQKQEILIEMLNHAIGSRVSDVTLFINQAQKEHGYIAYIEKFELDSASPEALVKQHTKLHTGMGRFKNISITGVAFLGTGTFGAEFKSIHKDKMKDFATNIKAKCLWNSRETCWVVAPEVMLWLLKQDWFNLDEVEFY